MLNHWKSLTWILRSSVSNETNIYTKRVPTSSVAFHNTLSRFQIPFQHLSSNMREENNSYGFVERGNRNPNSKASEHWNGNSKILIRSRASKWLNPKRKASQRVSTKYRNLEFLPIQVAHLYQFKLEKSESEGLKFQKRTGHRSLVDFPEKINGFEP